MNASSRTEGVLPVVKRKSQRLSGMVESDGELNHDADKVGKPKTSLLLETNNDTRASNGDAASHCCGLPEVFYAPSQSPCNPVLQQPRNEVADTFTMGSSLAEIPPHNDANGNVCLNAELQTPLDTGDQVIKGTKEKHQSTPPVLQRSTPCHGMGSVDGYSAPQGSACSPRLPGRPRENFAAEELRQEPFLEVGDLIRSSEKHQDELNFPQRIPLFAREPRQKVNPDKGFTAITRNNDFRIAGSDRILSSALSPIGLSCVQPGHTKSAYPVPLSKAHEPVFPQSQWTPHEPELNRQRSDGLIKLHTSSYRTTSATSSTSSSLPLRGNQIRPPQNTSSIWSSAVQRCEPSLPQGIMSAEQEHAQQLNHHSLFSAVAQRNIPGMELPGQNLNLAGAAAAANPAAFMHSVQGIQIRRPQNSYPISKSPRYHHPDTASSQTFEQSQEVPYRALQIKAQSNMRDMSPCSLYPVALNSASHSFTSQKNKLGHPQSSSCVWPPQGGLYEPTLPHRTPSTPLRIDPPQQPSPTFCSPNVAKSYGPVKACSSGYATLPYISDNIGASRAIEGTQHRPPPMSAYSTMNSSIVTREAVPGTSLWHMPQSTPASHLAEQQHAVPTTSNLNVAPTCISETYGQQWTAPYVAQSGEELNASGVIANLQTYSSWNRTLRERQFQDTLSVLRRLGYYDGMHPQAHSGMTQAARERTSQHRPLCMIMQQQDQQWQPECTTSYLLTAPSCLRETQTPPAKCDTQYWAAATATQLARVSAVSQLTAVLQEYTSRNEKLSEMLFNSVSYFVRSLNCKQAHPSETLRPNQEENFRHNYMADRANSNLQTMHLPNQQYYDVQVPASGAAATNTDWLANDGIEGMVGCASLEVAMRAMDLGSGMMHTYDQAEGAVEALPPVYSGSRRGTKRGHGRARDVQRSGRFQTETKNGTAVSELPVSTGSSQCHLGSGCRYSSPRRGASANRGNSTQAGQADHHSAVWIPQEVQQQQEINNVAKWSSLM